MANTFYQPEQVAQVAVAMAAQDAYLSALVNRDFESDLFGGGGKGRTVNVRIPAALIARTRGIDEKTAQIVLDELTEETVPLTLGTHAYSAIGLSEGDLTLNLTDFSAQVLSPQVEAVGDFIEHTVATTLASIAATDADDLGGYDPANPVPLFTAIRKALRDRGVPQTNLRVIVGTEVYANLLDSKQITDSSEAGSSEGLRAGNVGALRGFTVAESTRIADTEIIAFHRDAVTLACRAPLVPAGASFGATVATRGFSLRYLRDYDVMTTKDRSLVSTFVGAALMPMYAVNRNYTTNAVTVDAVAGGAAMRVDITSAS